VAEAAPPTRFTFRTIGDLAERCGQYCWIENRLFALTGMWASTPGAAGAAGAAGAVEAEIRVVCSAMSSWHGFVAGQWWDRLPVRAGVDPASLVVPPPGPFGPAFELLEADADLMGALGGLAEQILPALLGVYDEHLAGASPVSEAPVRALLGLVRPQLTLEIERGREALRRGPGVGAEADAGAEKRAGVAARLQRVLAPERAIFPAAPAS
jgi:hypothetical protein